MDSAEWLLLGGLVCCALLLLDGYRRVTRRQRSLAATPVDTVSPGSEPLLGNAAPAPRATKATPEEISGAIDGSLIGRTVNVQGRLETRETLRIEGQVEGNISADDQRVVVGTGARLAPRLVARELYLAGTCSGQMEVSDRVVIEMGARQEGQLSTARLHCHEGAWLQGTVDIGGRRAAPSRPVPPSLASPCLVSESR
ncbi:bactofilin family protein [Salinicola corii]|nr:polymer-forming cytoskeletal protein [Salinicola corii]